MEQTSPSSSLGEKPMGSSKFTHTSKRGQIRTANILIPPSKSTSSSKHGQIQTSDLMISLSIFMMLLIVSYVTWYRQIDISSSQLLDFRAGQAAQKALIGVVNSPGFPSNWASQGILPSSPSLLGMGAADGYGSIDVQKLLLMGQYYNDSNYHNITKMKLGISPFEGDIWVSYLDGTNISVMGNAPAANSTVLASRQRMAVYRNKSVMVRVRIWSNSTS